MEIQRRRYDELSLKACTNSASRKESGNENVNYWASAIAREAMPESVLINLVSVYDSSLTGTASKNENEICLAKKTHRKLLNKK